VSTDIAVMPANLPGELTLTSFVLRPGLSYEEYEEVMRTLGVMDKSVQWWIGDALNYGESYYGETYSQAMEETGIEYGTLAIYKHVSSRIEFLRRRKNLSFGHHQNVAALSPMDQDEWLDKAEKGDGPKKKWSVARHRAEMKRQGVAQVTVWTGDMERYTPAEYIECARQVLGGIDLDPASNDYAQVTVQAETYFTQESNGLCQEWHGRVWLNPPYSNPEIGQFIDKLIEEYEEGRTTAAILLTNNSADTLWFDRASRNAALVCFTKGRINFYDANDETTQPTNGQTFFYFGKDDEAFQNIFSQVGGIYKRLV
jgi:phage N-6-adenine-methyltransferase